MSTDSWEHHECGFKNLPIWHLDWFSYCCALCSTAPAEILSPQEPTAISLNETDPVSLTCIARGFPAVDITWWYQNTTQLMDSDPRLNVESTTVEINNGFLEKTSTLTIPSVDRADAGNYTCVASNTVFGSLMQDVQQFMLTVNCKCLTAIGVVHITVVAFTKDVSLQWGEKLVFWVLGHNMHFLISHMHTVLGSYLCRQLLSLLFYVILTLIYY